MAVAPNRPPPQVGSTVAFTSKVGLKQYPLLPSMPAPPPITQSSYLVGADTVAFDVDAGETITVTFPNLPNRSTANPRGLPQSGGSIAVAVFDTLHFAVALQGVTGTSPAATPQVVDIKRVRVPGPFLGGGNTYLVFQAVIVGAAVPSSGNVVGTLTYMVSSSG